MRPSGVPDFSSKPTLTGERAILRPFIDGDTPALLAALDDPDVRILTGSVHDEAAARQPSTPPGGRGQAGDRVVRHP